MTAIKSTTEAVAEEVAEHTGCTLEMAKMAVVTIQLVEGSMRFDRLVAMAIARIEELGGGTEAERYARLRDAYLMANIVSLRKRVEALEAVAGGKAP